MVKGGWGEFRGGSGGWGGGLGAPDRHEESCGEPDKPPPTSPTSTNLPQPSPRAHRKMIQSTPIVAARTTERTMFKFRGPAETGTAVISGAPYVRPTVRAAPGGAVARLTAMRIPEHSAKSSAAKWRKLIVANQYHTVPLAKSLRASSSTSRAVPITSPVQSAARAPVPLSLGYSTPRRKQAAMGGAM